MAYLRSLAAVAVVFLAVGQVCRPCGVVNWRPMTVAEQAAKAETIVYGTVIAHYGMPGVPIDRAYIAEMDVFCVMKGEALPPTINISEAGELTSCHHTLLPVNDTFITFLERDRDGLLVPDEVNFLSVAFEPTGENFRQVLQAVDFRERCPEARDIYNGASATSVSTCISAICIVVIAVVTRLQ